MNALSRRSALIGITLAGATGLVPVAAASMVDVTTKEATEWANALAEYERALAAKEAHQPTYDRVYDAYKAGKPTMDGIPWKEFPCADRCHVARVMDVEKAWTFFLEGEGKWWWARNAEARKAEFRAALDAVLDFRRREAENEETSGMNAAEKENEALWERLHATDVALHAMPAPHGEALLWKMENIWLGDEEASYSAEIVSGILADARRLLSNGKA